MEEIELKCCFCVKSKDNALAGSTVLVKKNYIWILEDSRSQNRLFWTKDFTTGSLQIGTKKIGCRFCSASVTGNMTSMCKYDTVLCVLNLCQRLLFVLESTDCRSDCWFYIQLYNHLINTSRRLSLSERNRALPQGQCVCMCVCVCLCVCVFSFIWRTTRSNAVVLLSRKRCANFHQVNRSRENLLFARFCAQSWKKTELCMGTFVQNGCLPSNEKSRICSAGRSTKWIRINEWSFLCS